MFSVLQVIKNLLSEHFFYPAFKNALQNNNKNSISPPDNLMLVI